MLRLKRENEELRKENLFLKKRHSLQGNRLEAYRFIEQYHNEFGIRWLLDGWVYAQMLITTTGNTGRRIIIPLKPKSKHRFRKYIIRTMELTAIGVWKSIWSVKVILTVIPPFINIWTQSLVSVRLSVQKPGYEHGNPHKVFDNKLKQNFTADEINRKWCTDFTYLFLANHEVRYNCTIIDLHDRSVIASITDRNITSDLAIRTLRKALESQPTIKDGLILHSDQGSQYTSKHLPNSANR